MMGLELGLTGMGCDGVKVRAQGHGVTWRIVSGLRENGWDGVRDGVNVGAHQKRGEMGICVGAQKNEV